ncbi:MAG: WG repeat-containing protein [Anaerolineaceae bacterium]
MVKKQGRKSFYLSMPIRKVNIFIILFILCILILTTSACVTPSSDSNGAIYFNVRSTVGSGIMDCSGNWIVEPSETRNGYFSGPMVNGLAPFYDASQIATPFSYINSDGEVAFDGNFRLAAPFSDGLAAVFVEDQWGFIDTTGKFVIEPRYSGTYIGSFSDGLVNVVDKFTVYHTPKTWVYVDAQGNQILGPYQDASSFTNGAAAVTLITDDAYKTGYIDTKGDFILEFSQEEGLAPTGSYSESLFAVKDVNYQLEEGACSIGFMNKDKEWVIEPQFCWVGLFVDGLAPVSRDEANSSLGPFGYITTSGEFFIEEIYNHPTNFSGGCALVRWDKFNSMGLIDTNGVMIYQYEAEVN